MGQVKILYLEFGIHFHWDVQLSGWVCVLLSRWVFLITVKHFYFAWSFFREAIALDIFTTQTRDFIFATCQSFFYNLYIIIYCNILARTLFSRPRVLANLCENKVFANKKCFTVVWLARQQMLSAPSHLVSYDDSLYVQHCTCGFLLKCHALLRHNTF